MLSASKKSVGTMHVRLRYESFAALHERVSRQQQRLRAIDGEVLR